jgi:hypothetical protein
MNNGRGLGIGRQAWLATSKMPKTTRNVSCHRVWVVSKMEIAEGFESLPDQNKGE